MKSLGRIALFVLTNLAIMITISVVIQMLGLRPYMSNQGIDYQSLMIFCLIWGMSGSLISLALSRIMAKWAMGVKVIDPNQAGQYAGLVNMVHQVAKRAGLPAMPEVGVFESPEVNAFATGPMKSRSLVAVSTGLLQSMNESEVEGVIGHEVAHIQNGDMVTMTLIQGVVNSFVMFFARIVAFFASQAVKEEQQYMVRMLVTIVLDILLGILGMIVVCWFSRQREFRADAGSAQLVGRPQMIAGLRNLQRRYGQFDAHMPESVAALKISGKKRSGFLALFATHPPLEERIARLESAV